MGLFTPPQVDVERHIEMRMRRVVPITWESGLKESYLEALQKFQKQVELERELWRIAAEASALKTGASIFSWLQLNLDELEKAIRAGDVASASALLSSLKADIEKQKKYFEEQSLQKEREVVSKGGSVVTSGSYYTYAPPKTTPTTPTTPTESKYYSYYVTVYSKGGAEVKALVDAATGQVLGYEAKHPSGGGISTRDFETAYRFATRPSQPSLLGPMINPFTGKPL